jgi:hypothetical protein
MRVFSELEENTGGAFRVLAIAVADAPDPPPPLKLTVGEEQAVPMFVMVSDATDPL